MVSVGREVLLVQSQAVKNLAESLGEDFDRAVDVLYSTPPGKVVLTGMGKSGIICRKIAATFSSTGTPAFFLHPAEGAHGDLGVLSHGDVVIAVSNSGETSEILGLLPLIRRMGLKLIAITGAKGSTLARRADVLLPIDIREEGCPLNLAPMASTTTTLALGDALAAALMVKRGVSEEDFAKVHPAGALGRKLTLRVQDMMAESSAVPRVKTTDNMKEVIYEMTGKGLGFTGVFEPSGELAGIITDGDLRRAIQKIANILDLRASEVMTRNPKTIARDTLAVDALALMEKHSITSLLVTEYEKGPVCGVIHIHHLVKPGL